MQINDVSVYFNDYGNDKRLHTIPQFGVTEDSYRIIKSRQSKAILLKRRICIGYARAGVKGKLYKAPLEVTAAQPVKAIQEIEN